MPTRRYEPAGYGGVTGVVLGKATRAGGQVNEGVEVQECTAIPVMQTCIWPKITYLYMACAPRVRIDLAD
jgi:hypothetical protein